MKGSEIDLLSMRRAEISINRRNKSFPPTHFFFFWVVCVCVSDKHFHFSFVSSYQFHHLSFSCHGAD
jgi:hypothetical protein